METSARRLLSATALAGVLALSGCLQFDAQEVHLHHDTENDRLDVMLVYRGLHSTKKDLSEAHKDLAHAQASGMFAFWDNWPLKVDVVKTKAPGKQLLKTYVEVETGGLFTDPAGLLCGYQFVRIKRVSRFVNTLNQVLALWVRTKLLAGKVGDGKLDNDTVDMLEDALRRPSFFSIEDGCLTLRAPCSDAGHRWFLDYLGSRVASQISSELLNQELANMHEQHVAVHGKDAPPEEVEPDQVTIPYPSIRAMLPGLASFRFLFENDVSIIREDGSLTIRLGVPGRSNNVLHKPPQGSYVTNMLDDLRQKNAEMEVGVPDQELERRFAAFQGRDAELPPELAAFLGRTPGK